MTESKSAPPLAGAEASARIDAKIAGLDDWRGPVLARVRELIRTSGPEIAETVKWGRVPVWEHAGILTTGEVYKAWVKLTFAQGAALPDPAGLFNAGLDGGTRRAIDIREGDTIDGEALQALIRAAAAHNAERAAARSRKKTA